MCSVVGYCTSKPLPYVQRELLSPLILQSKIRGLHSFGCSYWNVDTGHIHTAKFYAIQSLIDHINASALLDALFHSRYCTSGDWHNADNNQPVQYRGLSLAFNGVISMKTKPEMEEEYNTEMISDNDGELFLQHVYNGNDPIDFIADMKGSFAGLWYQDDVLYAARNERRPLWYVAFNGYVFFASTNNIIQRALGSTVGERAVQCTPNKLYILQDMI